MKSCWKFEFVCEGYFCSFFGEKHSPAPRQEEGCVFYFVIKLLNVSGISSPGFEVAVSHNVLHCLRNFDGVYTVCAGFRMSDLTVF